MIHLIEIKNSLHRSVLALLLQVISHAVPADVEVLGTTVQNALDPWDLVSPKVRDRLFVVEDLATLNFWALEL